MASRKNIWDTLDNLEGKKDSSHANLQKELKRQGYKKNHFEPAAKSKALKSKTGSPKDSGDMRPGMPGSGKFGRRKARGGGYEEYLEA